MSSKITIHRSSLLFAACASLVVATFSTQAHARAPLGIYGGAGCDGVRHMEGFSTWFGRRPDRAIEFISWAALLEDSPWSMNCWSAAGVSDVTYSVPMLPDDGSATLAQGAAGQFDELFRNLATLLVDRGYSHSVIRIGWEFNGEWYPWAASKDPQSWITYWRRIVDVMRSVPGAKFKFDWCPGNGWTSFLAENAYPGDHYVDYIGMDVYNASWSKTPLTPEQRWNQQLTQRHGLKWHADFAAAHGKPISFPEWGTGTRRDGHGGGDDPYFIEQMAEWIASHTVAYHGYWDYSAPIYHGQLSDGSQPNAGAAFLRKFKLPQPKPPRLRVE